MDKFMAKLVTINQGVDYVIGGSLMALAIILVGLNIGAVVLFILWVVMTEAIAYWLVTR